MFSGGFIISTKAIREEFRARRRALTLEHIDSASAQLTQRLLQLPETQASKTIAIYIAHENEIDTMYFMQELVGMNKELFLPVMTGNTLEFFRYELNDNLTAATNGISQPQAKSHQRIDVSSLDLMFLPLVAFDPQCYRLGRGGGFYDRALGKMLVDTKARPCLVGLAYDFQRVDSLPVDPWDVPLDAVVTESLVYRKMR